ncbi:MAG: outer membrane protein transport protein [Nitrospinae bacterium]|nr:outer membrane protein transport protein [Nitrospinota bacterium]
MATPNMAAASGFRIPEVDNAGTAMGQAVSASVTDAASVYHNPAAMIEVPNYAVKAGVQFIDPVSEFTSADAEYAGQNRTEKTSNTTFAVPSLYLVRSFAESGLAVGFGAFSNFGLGTSWSDYGRFRYNATDTTLRTTTYNLNVAKKFGDRFSAAVGVDMMTSDARLDAMYPFYYFEAGAADGYRIVKGTGNGYGFNAAVLFKPTGNIKASLTYRSKVKTTISGTAEILNFPGTLGALVGGAGGDYNSGAEVDINYPDIAVLGISWQANEKLLVEVDVDYTGWSSYDKLEFKFSKPLTLSNGVSLLPATSTQTKDWTNTTAIRVGAAYKITPATTLRAGYVNDKSAVPDATFDPRTPDSDRNIVSFGFGYRAGDRFTLDATYAYLWTASRTVNNTVGNEVGSSVDGDYKSTANIFGLSIGYDF